MGRKCCVVEMNVRKCKLVRISMQPSAMQIVMDQKQLEIVEYCSYLGSRITNDARCTLDITSSIYHGKSCIQRGGSSSHQQIGPTFKDETSKSLRLEHSFFWCWNWTVRGVDQKYLKRFKMWCWRRTEKLRWTACVKVKKYYIESRKRVISYRG